MPFVKVGELLAKRRPLLREERKVIDAMVIIGAWQSVVKDIQCVEKFNRTRAIAFRQGRLTVLANSNAAMSELKMCEKKIIAAYAKRLQSHVVERLVVKRS